MQYFIPYFEERQMSFQIKYSMLKIVDSNSNYKKMFPVEVHLPHIVPDQTIPNS